MGGRAARRTNPPRPIVSTRGSTRRGARRGTRGSARGSAWQGRKASRSGGNALFQWVVHGLHCPKPQSNPKKSKRHPIPKPQRIPKNQPKLFLNAGNFSIRQENEKAKRTQSQPELCILNIQTHRLFMNFSVTASVESVVVGRGARDEPDKFWPSGKMTVNLHNEWKSLYLTPAFKLRYPSDFGHFHEQARHSLRRRRKNHSRQP